MFSMLDSERCFNQMHPNPASHVCLNEYVYNIQLTNLIDQSV